jgi:uncharacterized protein YidB (DUF937 family)
MGLFDSIAGQVVGALSNTQASSEGGNLMGALSQVLSNPQFGGLSGLMDAFKSKGLGDIVSSWIGNGSNLPISMDQIQAALGHGPLQALAEKTGLSTDKWRLLCLNTCQAWSTSSPPMANCQKVT